MKIKSVLSLLLAATLVLGAAGTVYGEEPLKWSEEEYSEEYKEYLKDPHNPKWGGIIPPMYPVPGSETSDWLGKDYQEAMNRTPIRLKGKAETNSVKITFNLSKYADGSRVYMAESKKGKFTRIKTLKGRKNTVYTKKKLKTGKTYYFKVRAYKWKDGKMKWDSYSTVKKVTV